MQRATLFSAAECSVSQRAKHAKRYLSETVSEWSWQVTLASISSWVHGRQEAEVGVAGDPHQIPPLSNGHAASAPLQQTGYSFQCLLTIQYCPVSTLFADAGR